MRAIVQRCMVLHDHDPTIRAMIAIISLNDHQDHFGSVFAIQTTDGAVAHTRQGAPRRPSSLNEHGNAFVKSG